MDNRSKAITFAILWVVGGPIFCCGGVGVVALFSEGMKSDEQRADEAAMREREAAASAERDEQAAIEEKIDREKRASRPRACVETYAELHIGMTLSQVIAIIGPATEEVSRHSVGDEEYVKYIWYTGLMSGSLTAIFQDKVLISKQSSNLPTWENSK